MNVSSYDCHISPEDKVKVGYEGIDSVSKPSTMFNHARCKCKMNWNCVLLYRWGKW